MSFATAILVGGEGRRAGGAVKALLPFRGRSILDRQLDVLRTLSAEIFLVTSNDKPFEASGLRCVGDVSPGEGPLSAVCAALAAAAHDWVLVVAGDMPLLSAAVIERLHEYARQAELDIVCPRIDEIPQVLHAFYSKRALPRLSAHFQSGQRSLRAIVASDEELATQWVSERELRQIDADLEFLSNVNHLHQLDD